MITENRYLTSNLFDAAIAAISYAWDTTMSNVYQKEVPNPFENSGASWKCDVFEVEAFSWNEDYDQPYNFKWKDIEVSWYKWASRGTTTNRKVSDKEISEMLDDCLAALRNWEKQNSQFDIDA